MELEQRIRTACDSQAYEQAATVAIDAYGTELMGYLVALLRNAADADDVFAIVSENLWRSLPTFRWDSSLRTYAYTIARNAWLKHVRDPRNTRHVPLPSSSEAVAARERSRTATYLRTETKDKIAALRAELDPDDQTLLILRVNRQLPWTDIAKIMADEAIDDDAAAKRAGALRKRFERLKRDLRERATRA
jgi:RNA polymerase sigma-70 factor (ECF subfamily)